MPSTELRVVDNRTNLRALLFAILTIGCLFASALRDAHGQQPAPALPAAPPGSNLPALPTPPVSRLSVEPAFLVVIDAAHGGADPGARIGSQVLEKDLTLDFSGRLRSALAARGISVVVTREADTGLDFDQRTGIANHALASACLVLHATAAGSGVHLFTSSLPAAIPSFFPATASPIPWQTAQAAWITRGLRVRSEIGSALGQAGIPVTVGKASLRPLDNLACPAVAVEVAPLVASVANKAAPITDAAYQQRILNAVAAAMLEWRSDWRQQP